MKRLFLALAVVGMLAGCASHDNGTGGTSDQYNSNSGQYDNSSVKGTGTPMTTNNVNNTSP